MNVGETWVDRNDSSTEAKIVKIDGSTVWCEADFWRGWIPTDKEVFEKSMVRKEEEKVREKQLENYAKAAHLALVDAEPSTLTEAGEQRESENWKTGNLRKQSDKLSH